MKDSLQTPREARLYINQAEAWFRRNTDRFTSTDQVMLRGLFEYAHKPSHAQYLRIELAIRVRSKLPDAID